MELKSIVKKIIRYASDSNYRILVHAGNGIYNYMSDDKFLVKCFKARLGYPLNLNEPKTFNEKMQWLKLNDRNDKYVMMVDKYLVKDYVAQKIGDEYIIPTIGIWDEPSQIDFEYLPKQFVLKCNHNSGTVYICKDKNKLNKKEVLKILKSGMRKNYYLTGREWPYRNVKRKIIAEKFLVDESGTELKDYKIFCFNGKPLYVQVDFGRFTKHERNIYSTEWRYMGFSSMYPTNADKVIARPVCLEKMLEIASVLSKDIPFLRVDLYVIGDKIYFGEITFYHGSGYERFVPEEWDRKLGDLIDINHIRGKVNGEKNCDL